jgi:hypothetical protein
MILNDRSVGAMLAILVAVHAGLGVARGERPADALLRLAPPDAGLTVTVEDLQGHARELLDSKLAHDLQQLPAFRAWLASDHFRKLQTARLEIEAGLRTDLETLRDDLLGEAFLLAMHLPAGAPPEQARGLFLARVRDPATLTQLIEAINRAEGAALREIRTRQWRGVSYQSRRFLPGTKPEEWYVVLDEGRCVAWSNSEDLVRGVIDRWTSHRSEAGLLGLPRFRRVRDALPKHPFASLFVDPRFLERLSAAEPVPRTEEEQRLRGLILRHVQAVEYLGASFEWREGVVAHLHQELEPARLDEQLVAGTTSPGESPALRHQIPPRALVVAMGQLALAPLWKALLELMSPEDRGRWELLADVVGGETSTPTLANDLLTSLGPRVLAYLEAPAAETPGSWPWVVAVQIGGPRPADSTLSRSLAGRLRSALALIALQTPSGQVPPRIETRTVAGTSVTGLVGGPHSLAFAVGPDVVVIGSGFEAVARHRNGLVDGGPELRRRRAVYFPDVESFAYCDLDALRATLQQAESAALLKRLARNRPGATIEDLEQAIALMGLFRFGYITSRIAPGYEAVHHTLGLIAQEPSGEP